MKRQLCIYSPNTLLYPLYLLYYIHYIFKMFWVVLLPHNCFYWFLNEHMWSLILLLFFFTWNLYYLGLTLKPLIFSMKCVVSKQFKDRRNYLLQIKSMTWSLSFFFFFKNMLWSRHFFIENNKFLVNYSAKSSLKGYIARKYYVIVTLNA